MKTALVRISLCAFALAGVACSSPRSVTLKSGGVPSAVWYLEDFPKVSELVLFRNGQSVMTTSNDSSEPGLRGYWRPTPSGTIVIFEDGSSLTLESGSRRCSWKNTLPGNRSGRWHMATDVTQRPESKWVGLWRLNPEPDNRYLYVQLHADGSAESSLADSRNGSWKPWNGGALCSWPGGWRDWIVPAESGFWKRSWPPGSPITDDPSDTSIALRVGEQPFTIVP